MINLLMKMAEQSPAFRRFLWHRWYQYLAGYRLSDWHFMNYGFQAETGDAEQLQLEAADEPNRYCIQLYDRVAAPFPCKNST